MGWKKGRAPKSNTSLLKLAVYEGITMDIEACRNRECMNFVISPEKVCVKCLKGNIDLINEEEVVLKSKRLRENYYNTNNTKVKVKKTSLSIDKEVTLFLSQVIINEGFRLWGMVPHPIIEGLDDGYKSRKIKTMLEKMKEIFQEWHIMKYGTNSPYLFNKEMLDKVENYHDTFWDKFIYFDNEPLLEDGRKSFPLFKEIK